MSDSDPDAAEQYVGNALAMLSDFDDEDTTLEEQHGILQHSIEELRNAQRSLSDDF